MLTRTLALAVIASLVTACAANKVRVDKAADAATACKTFDWRRVSEAPESFTEQRVRDAVFKELASKGYNRATEHPDCQITYGYDTQERAARKPSVGVGVGGGSGGLGGGLGISIPVGKGKQPGHFAIDVIKTASNAQIWHGSVETVTKTSDLSAEEATQLAHQVLAKFPDAAHAEH